MYRIRTAITGGPGGAEVNTMYFNTALLTAQNAATAVTTFWNSVKSVIHSSYTMNVEDLVTTVADFTGVPIGTTVTSTAAVVGTNGTDPLPPATQGLIETHTGVFYGGRELKGRIFIPGPCEANNSSGRPDAAYLTAVNAAVAALIADPNSELMCFSRRNLNANGVTGGATWQEWSILNSRRS